MPKDIKRSKYPIMPTNFGRSIHDIADFQPEIRSSHAHKGAPALGGFRSPFIIQGRGETPVWIGIVDPLTGVYAAPAGNGVMGTKLAVEQMNANGGILGRQVELLVDYWAPGGCDD